MVNIKEEAFVFTMDYVHNIMDYVVEDELSGDKSDIPYFRNIHISDCTCVNAERGIYIKGLEGDEITISDITFENCKIVAEQPDEMTHCANITMQ